MVLALAPITLITSEEITMVPLITVRNGAGLTAIIGYTEFLTFE